MTHNLSLITGSIALTCLLCLGFRVPAQAQTAASAALGVQPLKGGIYWVKGGSGANTGFVIGAKEVILIDAKMTEESAKAMLAEIRKLTPNPVRSMVLTHSDGDHVNGLSGLPTGLTIIAHANARKDMEAAFRDPKMSTLEPYLPNQTLTSSRPLNIDGIRMNLLYFGPAHTSGDLVVYFPDQKIAFVGDLAFVGRDPLIHRQKGGTSFGLVQVLGKILALDADTFITGHSDPLSKADIQALLTSIEDKQSKVKSLLGEGKSLDEIKTALGLASAQGQRFPSLIDVIYQELSGK